ncbi:MAG: phosphatidylglycerophosphatase A [Chloroflexi bacterium]|nr:phosphatidylglycerophosphatase A [Chloroflexota bacterium]
MGTPADPDPKRVVIDEWVGVWATVAFLPTTWTWLLAGFLLFRALDIAKPFGIRKLEKIHGGFGVMMDDLAAGVAGAIILNAVRLVFF